MQELLRVLGKKPLRIFRLVNGIKRFWYTEFQNRKWTKNKIRNNEYYALRTPDIAELNAYAEDINKGYWHFCG
ncbi:hypothetical protein T01_5611 [Trichinella spiralis]|uniref:Uncharacterized protein n=1 Tax=Trichinella spiralis TaxID=6334 RepID=A0A0V1BYB8_TRISP|nr:hypothetical protein T01_5611 [Trichinella spiralis]